MKDWLQACSQFDLVQPEKKHGNSRFDFYLEQEGRPVWMEVKGCTLEIDGVGMNTYRQIVTELSPQAWVYAGLESYVLTHENQEDKEDIKFRSANIKDLIRELKQMPGKNIWICGGASLIAQCMKADLIDEYEITTVPVILGSGIRLFPGEGDRLSLHLKQIHNENGLVTSIYERRNHN